MVNILHIIEVLAPLSFLIILGFIINKGNLITKNTTIKMNKVVFSIFLPTLIFYNLYTAKIQQIFNWTVIIFAGVFTIVVFLFSLIIIPLIENENSKRSVLIHCVFRGNIVLLGLPIVTELYGFEGTALVTLIISVVTPLYNVLAVLCFEIFNKSEFNLKRASINIFKNPLIIASILGLVALFIDLQLPYIVEKFLSDIARTASPLALILLGGYFEIRHSEFRLIVIGLIGRLVLVPLLCIVGSILMGFKGVELISLLVLSCTPTAVSTFAMTSELEGDTSLASDLYIYSTIASAITIPGWIFLAQSFGFF